MSCDLTMGELILLSSKKDQWRTEILLDCWSYSDMSNKDLVDGL